jgi:hypothetical protein
MQRRWIAGRGVSLAIGDRKSLAGRRQKKVLRGQKGLGRFAEDMLVTAIAIDPKAYQ